METETAEVGPFTRWSHRVYFLYLMLVPTLMLGGFYFDTDLRSALEILWEEWLGLNILAQGSLLVAAVLYLGIASERCRPPANPWLALLFVADAPLLVLMTSLASGEARPGILLYDGVIELVGVSLALTAVSFRWVYTQRQFWVALGLGALLCSGPVFLLICLVALLGEAHDWGMIAGLLVAVAWSALIYLRLVQSPRRNKESAWWAAFGLLAPLLGVFMYGVIHDFF